MDPISMIPKLIGIGKGNDAASSAAEGVMRQYGRGGLDAPTLGMDEAFSTGDSRIDAWNRANPDKQIEYVPSAKDPSKMVLSAAGAENYRAMEAAGFQAPRVPFGAPTWAQEQAARVRNASALGNRLERDNTLGDRSEYGGALRQSALDARADQQAAMRYMGGVMRGQNSAAEQQAAIERQAAQRAIAGQMASAQRGGFDPAIARMAARAQVGATDRISERAMQARLQEQQAAAAAYFGMGQQQRQEDRATREMAARTALAREQQWLKEQLGREALAQSYYGMGVQDKDAARAMALEQAKFIEGLKRGQVLDARNRAASEAQMWSDFGAGFDPLNRLGEIL